MSTARAVDRAPARLSSRIAVGFAFVSLVAVGPQAWSALLVAALGFLSVVGAVVRGSRIALGLGTAGLLSGTILAGLAGAPAVVLLPSAATAVLSWDAGQSAIGIGEQLGRGTETRRIELGHAAASTAVGVLTVGFGYGLFRVVSGTRPLAGVVLLVTAAIFIASALR